MLKQLIRAWRMPGEDNKSLITRVSVSSEKLTLLSEMLPDLHGQAIISIINDPNFYQGL